MSPFSRLGDFLPFGRVADEAIAIVGECDHAGGEPIAFLIGDDLDLAPFHDGNTGVGWENLLAASPFAREPSAAAELPSNQ